LRMIKESYDEYDKATKIAGIILMVAGVVEGGITFYNVFQTGEALAARTLFLEEQEAGGHFFSRHGAQTSLSQQYMRAVSGLIPDAEAVSLGEVNATRFLTNEGQLKALERAKDLLAKSGKTSGTFTFEMETEVGEGYLKGGGAGSYRRTNLVQAVFKDGKLKTLYPAIKK
jgi:hypothetical protein